MKDRIRKSRRSVLFRTGLAALLGCSLITHGKFCLGQTISLQATPEKLDEYRNLTSDDEAAHLDLFAEKLLSQPRLRGQIISYSDPLIARGSYLRRIHGRARYLTDARGIEPNRIAVIDAGYKEQLSTELWLIPEGAKPPPVIPKPPQPSIKISSAYKFDEECLDCAEAVGLTLYGLDEGQQFYADALRQDLSARGLFIVRPDEGVSLRTALKEAGQARRLLVKRYGIDVKRLIVKSAPSRKDGTAVIEMWIVPAGAKFPSSSTRPLQQTAQ